jgi:hypothetical protein
VACSALSGPSPVQGLPPPRAQPPKAKESIPSKRHDDDDDNDQQQLQQQKEQRRQQQHRHRLAVDSVFLHETQEQNYVAELLLSYLEEGNRD